MASTGETAWASAAREHGWLTGPEADTAACDATVVPIVTGRVDPAALDRLVDAFLAGHGPASHGPASPASAGRAPLSPHTRQRLAGALLGLAADALSGPGGLAARLRGGLDGTPVTSVSLPLDVGAASETIPVHLRRLVSARHPHCAFPGCEQPASVCDVHHLVPRADGGATALPNLVSLCSFHHLVAVHRWGWQLRMNPDGTTTATGPDGRILHSHGPPTQAA